MRRDLLRLWNDDSGQDLIEYALVVALVATGSAILIPQEIHTSLSHVYSRVSSCLERYGTGGG